MKKDLVYRFNLAGVSAVVISSTGSIVDEAEKPLSNATSKRKYLSGQAVTAGTISTRNFRRFRTNSNVAKALTQLIKRRRSYVLYVGHVGLSETCHARSRIRNRTLYHCQMVA